MSVLGLRDVVTTNPGFFFPPLLSLKKPGWYWPVDVTRAGDLTFNPSGLRGMARGLHMVEL